MLQGKNECTMNNPFTLTFGKKPLQYVSRLSQTGRILESFTAEHSPSQVYMITGVRGSGKTVMMASIVRQLKEDGKWITLELNPARDLLQSFAAGLYALPEMHALFVKARLDFSAFGLGAAVEGAAPVTDIEQALGKMLEAVGKTGRRVLIAIDEAVNNEFVRVFASAFQIFMRQEYPVYLLMTGLYENLYDLQNDDMLTFLYRAPKIVLEPLNFTAVEASYARIFGIDRAEAHRMALYVKGYPFAFQVLGYLRWESRDLPLEDLLPEYDQYLAEYVYEKIWSELSEKDRKVVKTLPSEGSMEIREIRSRTGLSSECFSVYRERLKRKGLVNTSEYGELSLTLPRFAEFADNQYT